MKRITVGLILLLSIPFAVFSQIAGLDALVDPVAQYLPELAELKVYEKGRLRAMRKPISIRDLMRHTAGFTYVFFSHTKVDKLYNKKYPLSGFASGGCGQYHFIANRTLLSSIDAGCFAHHLPIF